MGNNYLLDWFTAKYPEGYMFKEYVPLVKLEKKLYEIFCNHAGSLFTKKFLHVLLQSTRRVNCDPSIRYFMDTEDWYEAVSDESTSNAFDAKDEQTLQVLALKHVERYMTEKRVAPAPKYITDGETVWTLKK